ncbi:sigma factor-like helix-turn-helix DNA-binding protein [Microbispora bryophytorum]|uniref:RNA polymerase sigma-70 region 4 domain-containing protein n=1 Tax=Microbispora bryophytorum TaxID=1460882 RepID=A0A8H9GTV6_9ACTN|nr:sigma factor-like helix-turn-helix DNA-binding protein [Microbispora bryophytorum]MBD3135736.1 RNA polymerase subunit sigma-70 [Microbispora bryophytorum]GGN99208.1 hypothetical protein GCM10011574_04590 [Microbispora bryophytorum]
MEKTGDGALEGDWLVDVWRTLDQRSRDMLTMRAKNRTLDSIGRAYGVSRERARQVIRNAQCQLSEKARCAAPEWATGIFELLETRAAVSDDYLSETLRDDSGLVRASLLMAEGLCHPKAWSEELTDHWSLSPEALDGLLRELAEEAPCRKDELRDHAANIGLPESLDIDSIMSAGKSPLVLDESGSWVRRTAKKRDAAYLWLADQGEPRRAEAIAEAIALNSHATAEALRRDNRFRQVRPEGTWALTDWPLDGVSEHTNALDVMIQVLADLGPLPRRELTNEVRRRYPVSYSRVQQCLISSRIGLTPDGRIGLVEHGALSTEEKEPRRPDNAVHDEELGLLAFRLTVDKDVVRGSGIIISPWITWQLGLRQAPMEKSFTLQGSDRQIVFRRVTSAAQMSSLRLEVSEQGMVLGCELAVVLRLQHGTMTIRHVCAPGACPTA